MNMKKIAILALALCMVAAIAVTGTIAYFVDSEDATNTFTVGNVDIELTEPKWDSEGSEDAPEVYPTEALAKDPTVTNIGDNPCFVRVSVTGWDSLIQAGLSKNNITYRTDYTDGKLGDNWVLHTDGYFYYTKVLTTEAPNNVTDALFDQIVIPADVINGNGETEYNIDVKAYAVQAQGAKPSFSAVEAMTVEEIAAWFGTAYTE